MHNYTENITVDHALDDKLSDSRAQWNISQKLSVTYFAEYSSIFIFPEIFSKIHGEIFLEKLSVGTQLWPSKSSRILIVTNEL